MDYSGLHKNGSNQDVRDEIITNIQNATKDLQARGHHLKSIFHRRLEETKMDIPIIIIPKDEIELQYECDDDWGTLDKFTPHEYYPVIANSEHRKKKRNLQMCRKPKVRIIKNTRFFYQ